MPKKEIQEVRVKRDRYDWLMLILMCVSTFSVLFGITVQLPKIQKSLENLNKTYNASVSDSVKITESLVVCITRAKTPHITECSTCHEYPVEQINATLRICDISITDSVTNITNKTQELKLLK